MSDQNDQNDNSVSTYALVKEEEHVTDANRDNLADAADAAAKKGVDPEKDGIDAGQTTANTVGDVLGV